MCCGELFVRQPNPTPLSYLPDGDDSIGALSHNISPVQEPNPTPGFQPNPTFVPGPRSHHIPRVSAVPDLGPLLRVQKFEEQKHRLEHLSVGSTNYALNSSPDAVICSTHPRFQLV